MAQGSIVTTAYFDDLTWGALRKLVAIADEAGIGSEVAVKIRYAPDPIELPVALELITDH